MKTAMLRAYHQAISTLSGKIVSGCYLRMLPIAFWFMLVCPGQAWVGVVEKGMFQRSYPGLSEETYRLMEGYWKSLEPFAGLNRKGNRDLASVLKARRNWNERGYSYTQVLLRTLTSEDPKLRFRSVILLGGTRDDRAAIALRRLLNSEPEESVKMAILSSLAELGYYSEYHSGQILEAVRRGGFRAELYVEMLCIIHHPEAIENQNSLRKLHLIDGGAAEMESGLLDVRDYALGLPNRH